MLLGLRFQELSWDHTSPEEEEPVLWLEFDGDSDGTPVNKLLRIYSKQVVMYSHILRQRLGPGPQRTPNHGSSQVPRKEHGMLPRAWEEGGRALSALLWDHTPGGDSCRLSWGAAHAICTAMPSLSQRPLRGQLRSRCRRTRP